MLATRAAEPSVARAAKPCFALAAKPCFVLAAMVFLAGAARAVSPSPDLLAELERAPAVVVGRVESVTALAHGGHLARIEPEQVLTGHDASKDLLLVAWEEPTPALPPRLSEGQVVVLGLSPMPTASIWRTRIPDDEARAQAVSIAGAGGAYLLRPSPFDLDALEHYLAMSQAAREGDGGEVRLAEMAQGGSAPLAISAWGLFTQRVNVEGPLSPLVARSLVDALTRDDAGDLPERIVGWVDRTRPEGLLLWIDARLAADPTQTPPTALLSARAALTGGLDPESVETLAESDDPARRLLAAQRASGDDARTLLPFLVRNDPAAPVRAAALAHWVSLAGEAAMPEALGALDDPDAPVRKQAAESLASLGEVAIGPLVNEVDRGTPDAARTAVVALAMMGEPGRAELMAIAEGHDDEAMRTLARVALGLPIGHLHD
jgi:hypothetical protein